MSERLRIVLSAIRCAFGLGRRRNISPEARLHRAGFIKLVIPPDVVIDPACSILCSFCVPGYPCNPHCHVCRALETAEELER